MIGRGIGRGIGGGIGLGIPITPYKFEVLIENNAPVYLFITGITKDSTSTPLASCVVKLYRTSDDVEISSTISDGSGNYTFPIQALATGGPYYIVAYKAGSPDVAGTTVNTLVAS